MKPIEKAWMMLKRQTRLGEHHADFPSQYGDITHYHGTTDDRGKGIVQQGLLVGDNEAFGRGVYASPNPSTAKNYAMTGAMTNQNLPAVFAIRGKGLEQENVTDDYTLYPDNISPERLVRIRNVAEIPTWVDSWKNLPLSQQESARQSLENIYSDYGG